MLIYYERRTYTITNKTNNGLKSLCLTITTRLYEQYLKYKFEVYTDFFYKVILLNVKA